MCNIFKGRTEPCNNTIGGITKMYLFTYTEYRRYEIEVNESTLVKYPTTTIYEYELRSDENIFTEDLEQLPDRIKYNQNITGILKQINVDYENTAQLLNKKIGCIVKTRLNKYQILGLYNGCRVKSVKFTTGGNKTSFNGSKISIKAQETKPAFYIDDLLTAGFIIDEPETDFYLLQENGSYLLQENGFKIIL